MTTVLESLNAGLHRAMAEDGRVVLVGEDLLDPYGGAFKVTRGLSTAFPKQVFTTPISEAGITGLAAGMALRGLRPVVEIMFGDFTTLIADQVINHAAKFRWMYNDQVRVPLVVRTPMGGRRGYGPTHSQTLEKLFLGVPGLRVLAPANVGDPGDLLYRAILENEDPLLFIENKLQYLLPVADAEALAEFDLRESADNSGGGDAGILSPFYAPAYNLTLHGAPPPSLTIAAYGYMADLARQALLRLAYDHEIFAELVVLTQLAPFTVDVMEPVLASARQTGRLLVVEEGSLSLGWGAEVVARAVESLGMQLKRARRVAAADQPVPASTSLEAEALPGESGILQAAIQMVVV